MKINVLIIGIVLSLGVTCYALAEITDVIPNNTARDSRTAANDNVHFSGAVVTEPCTFPDSDLNIVLSLGSVGIKELYQSSRTKSAPFIITLGECDPAIMDSVSVTFKGTGDDELPDMLAMDAGETTTASGIAIGLEMQDGTALALNKPAPPMALQVGTTLLTFMAFIQAKPSAMANHSLVGGAFQATSTFVLDYQ